MTRHELGVLLVRVDSAQLAVKNAWTRFDQARASDEGDSVRFDRILSPAFAAQRRAYEDLASGVREFLSTGGK